MASDSHGTLLTLRPCVQAFAEAMEWALRANDHKGGWRGMQDENLITRLNEECRELRAALRMHLGAPEILREAADVANFCMFIADNHADLG